MLRISRSEPGYALSAAVHFGLLAAMLIAFSTSRKFEDAQESVPVDTITDAQFSQIMKGVKTAKEATGKPRVDKVAEKEELKPTPPTPEARREIAAPPTPQKRLPDPSEAEDKPTPPAPTPPPRPTPTPPPEKPAPEKPAPEKPAPPRPAPPKPAPPEKEEPEKPEAEPVKPPPRPKPAEKPPEKPTEKPQEKPQEKPTPKPPEKPTPKPAEKPAPKLDEVAKLLNEHKDKPVVQPKSGGEGSERKPPDLAEISRLLSREAPSAIGSTGRETSRTAALGAPHASAERMSPSVSDALNSLLQEQYKACWSYLPLSGGPKYIPKIRIAYRPDGSLARPPVLVNPPSDPQSRALADSAMRAVRRCDPLRIPARFQPYHEQWKDWVIGFDPDDLN